MYAFRLIDRRSFSYARLLRRSASVTIRVIGSIGDRNKYRIVVWINYPYRVVYVRFIGTHWQYDKIDAQTV
jgi:mRNA interferase HigB